MLSSNMLLKLSEDNALEALLQQAYNDPTDKKFKPLFIFFMNRECDECWQHAKDWNQLAQVANKQFIIAFTDCHFDGAVCHMFMVDKFPYVILLKDNKIIRYEGSLELNELLNFLSADNYKEHPIIVNNLQDYADSLTGGKTFTGFILKKSEQFLQWLEKKAKEIFKKIGLSHWSENAKITIFALIVVGTPTVAFTFYIMKAVSWLFNDFSGNKKKKIRRRHSVPQHKQFKQE